MHPSGSGDNPIDAGVLDVGRDDYYAHSGGWIDVRDSLFLRRLDVPQQPLTVTLGGSVGGEPGAERRTRDRLSDRLLDPLGWRRAGGARGHSGHWSPGRPLDERVHGHEHDLRADSRPAADRGRRLRPLSYSGRVLVAGRGRVTNGLGFSCVTSCNRRFEAGRNVAFRAAAAKGWVFAGWQGDCRGRTGACRVRFDGPHTIRAVFRRR